MAVQKKRDPEATRISIIEAATGLFMDKGLDGVAVSEIAKAAGVTKSLIHHHFGSKEGLWDAVTTDMLDGYAAEQSALLENENSDGISMLKQSVGAYFKFLKDNPSFVRLCSWSALESREDSCNMRQDLIEWGVRRIEDAQIKGSIRKDIDPSHIIIAFLSMTEQWFTWRGKWDLRKPPASKAKSDKMDRDYLNSIFKILFDGIKG